MQHYFFILGAPDPEMREIEDILSTRGLGYGFASKKGKRVNSSQAYRASGVIGTLPKDVQNVFIECDVKDITPSVRIDHHNPGDPGFDKGPADYWDGSSLGQLCQLLEITPTPEQLIIAAADHCLTHAYAGMCPGVDTEDLAYWRLSNRARVQGRALSDVQKRIQSAISFLLSAPKFKIKEIEVADVGLLEGLTEIGEASARLNMPYVYAEIDKEGRLKKGIKGAPAEVIQHWLDSCNFTRTYGCPARGYAGAYGPMVKNVEFAKHSI